MCFGLSKDKKLNRDKKIKPEKILRRDSAGENSMQPRER
jgi:hypothetical protein